MATPHKALLIQARDALLSACGGRCNAEYNPCDYKEVADALTAAIDAPEPYDQQALEPCPVCGWKAIVPVGRKVTTTRIANHLKKSPLGDISMYRDGFFDGAKWATKETPLPRRQLASSWCVL